MWSRPPIPIPNAKEKYIIYAQSGDFAGNSVYGICFGIPLIMYLIWFAFILGFPDRVDPYLLPRRIFTIAVIICLLGHRQPLPDAYRRRLRPRPDVPHRQRGRQPCLAPVP